MRLEDLLLDQDTQQVAAAQQSFITKTYGWMAGALVITALVAMNVANSEEYLQLIFGNKLIFWGLMIAQFGVVVALSAAIERMSALVASALFVGYAALTGVTLASVFVVFTSASIASTFGICAITFGAMSLYGYTTKRDLTTVGNLAFMALIGLVVASIVNMFLASTMLYWITTYVGVLIFVALIAYDTQKLKEMAASGFMESANSEVTQKYAIRGALTLYLDFINLFLMLLRIFGNRK